jgi:hypothetical protein
MSARADHDPNALEIAERWLRHLRQRVCAKGVFRQLDGICSRQRLETRLIIAWS